MREWFPNKSLEYWIPPEASRVPQTTQSDDSDDGSPTTKSFYDWLVETARPGWSYDAKHFRSMAALADQAIAGEIDRIRIHMPPRHGKTRTWTTALPVFLLLNNPNLRILITAYNDRFARKLSREIRNRFIELGGRVADDKFATDEWFTAEGGMVMARGVGTPPTGEGFDWIFIDDPVRKREDAESETYREKLWDWYTDDLYSRLQPKGVLCLIMTLWHEQDLGGMISEQQRQVEESGDVYGDRWTELRMAAIAEENDALGREPGEALWPEQWPLAALLRKRAAMVKKDGERSWYALFQQQPTPAAGDMFDVSKLGYCKRSQVPPNLKESSAWDVGASKSGDPSVRVKMAGPDSNGKFYVLHVIREKLNTGERDNLMLSTAKVDGDKCKIGVPRDPSASGKSQVLYWMRLLVGFSVTEMPTSKDKATRVAPYSTQVNNGFVVIVEGAWNLEYVEELRTFPGKHDDQVDASGDAFKLLTAKRTVTAH